MRRRAKRAFWRGKNFLTTPFLEALFQERFIDHALQFSCRSPGSQGDGMDWTVDMPLLRTGKTSPPSPSHAFIKNYVCLGLILSKQPLQWSAPWMPLKICKVDVNMRSPPFLPPPYSSLPSTVIRSFSQFRPLYSKRHLTGDGAMADVGR